MTDTFSPQMAPHSQEAEEAVLGSVLINPDAFYEVASFLTPDDFFLLRNSWVWEAMLRLHERNEIIDYLTVTEELKSQERLADMGGMAYITYLTSNTPTSIHAEAYGRIVHRSAIRRRLLEAAEEITNIARQEDADINEVIDKAEGALFRVTEQRAKQELVPMQQALSDYYDRIERLYTNRDEKLGVPSGFHALDNLLGGFQKGDLVIIAARPGMGKTSLMLNMAINAARSKARSAVFSLEMSTEQLMQRMMSTETRINQQKLRLGQLNEHEWDLFVEATVSLGNLKIFLDDTPALSVMQLRTKCRRLSRESGLDIIMVDYLQLMTTGGRLDGSNNRVQEISNISRNLKEIAREINVPLIAGAQLSRAVEQRTDKKPVLSDLRESGCLAGDTLITLADTGINVPIRELVGKSGFAVWALNLKTWKLERALVSNAFSTGVKPVFRLTTQLGRSIRATANHPFLTICGWKRLDELTEGDFIAVPRKLDSPTTQTMSDAELALLGHLIGDGCILPKHAIQYTTREHDLAEKVVSLATEVFGDAVRPRIKQERNWYQVYLPPTKHLTHNVKNPIGVWLQALGIWGLRSYEKFVPSKVFEQPSESIAIFLRHLWATDGCIRYFDNHYVAIYYATSSPQLAQDVYSLLLRLGINGRLKRVPQKGKGRDQYQIWIGAKANIDRFINLISAVGMYKRAELQKIAEYVNKLTTSTDQDIIPSDIWQQMILPEIARKKLKKMEVRQKSNTVVGRNLSRDKAMLLAQVIQSEELTALSSSDVYWDKIDSIIHEGTEEVFDLTIPEHHNFTANNFTLHNSIEQDADVVMFIYRDDMYNEATERPNEADIIVAKHRNGPTGTIELFFNKELTQFNNLKRSSVNLEDM